MKIKLHVDEKNKDTETFEFEADICPEVGESFSYEDEECCYDYLSAYKKRYTLGTGLNYVTLFAYSEG